MKDYYIAINGVAYVYRFNGPFLRNDFIAKIPEPVFVQGLLIFPALGQYLAGHVNSDVVTIFAAPESCYKFSIPGWKRDGSFGFDDANLSVVSENQLELGAHPVLDVRVD